VRHDDGPGILTLVSTESASPPTSVVRSWSARATAAGGDAYVAHFRSSVLPALGERSGHRGALVLRRPEDGLIRITVLTVWTSMAAVVEFAGADPEAAVVEPAARAVLADFDTRVTYFEVALNALP
jgi:heme-degrading monooxygenase HmoA